MYLLCTRQESEPPLCQFFAYILSRVKILRLRNTGVDIMEFRLGSIALDSVNVSDLHVLAHALSN
jgi:hypothetical protein